MNPLQGGTPPDGDFARLIDELGRDSAERLRVNAPAAPMPSVGQVIPHAAPRTQTAEITAVVHSPGRVVRTPSSNADWEVLVQAVAPALPWLKGVFFSAIVLLSVGAILPPLKPIGWTAWLFYTLYGVVRFKIPREAVVYYFHRALDRANGKI